MSILRVTFVAVNLPSTGGRIRKLVLPDTFGLTDATSNSGRTADNCVWPKVTEPAAMSKNNLPVKSQVCPSRWIMILLNSPPQSYYGVLSRTRQPSTGPAEASQAIRMVSSRRFPSIRPPLALVAFDPDKGHYRQAFRDLGRDSSGYAVIREMSLPQQTWIGIESVNPYAPVVWRATWSLQDRVDDR
jgi:hypothetical protein